MKKLTILLVGLLLLSVVLGPISCGNGDEEEGGTKAIVWRLSHIVPATTAKGIMAEKFAEMVEEKTDGRLKIKVFPSCTLFGPFEEWDALATRAVEMTFPNVYFALDWLPYMKTGFLEFWEGYEHVYRFNKDTTINDMIRADLEPKGVYHLGLITRTHMSAMVSNSKELKNREDLRGLRFTQRAGAPILPSQVYFGLVAREVQHTEMLTAFSTGVTELHSDSVTTLAPEKIWEYGGVHALFIGGLNMPELLEVSLYHWNKLPADIQVILQDEVMPEFYEFCYSYMLEEEAAAIEVLKANLDTWHEESTEQLQEAWQQVQTVPLAQTWIEEAGPEVIQIIDALRPSGD